MKYKTFREIIYETSECTHSLKPELKTGIYDIPPGPWLNNFKKLYRPSGTTKNTGNGEIAIFWLFDKLYGGQYDVVNQGGTEVADLLISGIPVEVKGWDHDILSGKRIKIGRFESIHWIRRIINIVFGAYNTFYAGQYSGEHYGKNSYLSEISFGMNGLTRGFDCALRIKEINFQHLNNLREVLEHPIYEGLEDPEDFAAKTFVVLAKEKLLKKIGSGNFIVNARPDKIGRIEIFQLGDLENVNFEMIKNEGARVQCSELFLNITAFEQQKPKKPGFKIIRKQHQYDLFTDGKSK